MKKLLVTLFILTLTACGGGSSSSGGGTATTGTFTGPITGIGSIVVNGIRFETVGVSVEDSDDIYGTTSFNSPLALGMNVALVGNIDDSTLTGTPTKIRVIGGVRGLLSAKTLTSITTLNGQVVNVDSNTIYAGLRTSLADLVTNDFVEIYGASQANGDFLAARVVSSASLSTINKLAIRGTIDSISGNNYVVRTSSTSTVTVTCNPNALPACSIKPTGTMLVAASGSVAGTPVRIIAADSSSLNAGILTAVKIQSLSPKALTDFSGLTAAYAKIKGYTTQVGADWYVAGVKVTGYPFTVTGQYVEVKGTWSDSVLQATKVEFESDRQINGKPYNIELYGAVFAKSGNTFAVQGTTVDASSAIFTGGNLASLTNGNYVEVKGSLSNGILVAIKVEVKTANSPSSDGAFAGSKFEVYGTVSGWTDRANTFTLTALNAGGSTYTTLASSAIISGSIVNGSVIEAKGSLDANQRFVISKLKVKDANFMDRN
jgi:hypothetical protein